MTEKRKVKYFRKYLTLCLQTDDNFEQMITALLCVQQCSHVCGQHHGVGMIHPTLQFLLHVSPPPTLQDNTCIVATSSSSFSMVSFLLSPLLQRLQTRNGDRKYQTCLIFPMVNIKHVLTFDNLISAHSVSSGVVALMRHVLMMRVRSIIA